MKNIKNPLELIGLIIVLVGFCALMLLGAYIDYGQTLYFQTTLILTTITMVVGIIILVRIK